MSDKKKYNYMENVLQGIIKRTISLDDKEVKVNNVILASMVSQLLAKVRENPLFDLLYQKNFCGGSFYDGLKIEKPEEYDLDLIMVFPKNTEVELKVEHDVPGFVSARIKNASSELKCLLDGEYLNPSYILKWMEGVFTKAIQQFPMSGNQYIMNINETDYFIKICKSGPAFTVKLNGTAESENHVFLDVDLVPCFIFDEKLWPDDPFRQNPIKDKTTFFIVPKIPKHFSPEQSNHCWRLSFQEQERELMKGCKVFKPSMKLLKKLRDKLQMKSISSYFIKSVFLWQVLEREASFWENSLSFVFMEMLTIFTDCLSDKKILYFWNDNNNLIQNIDDIVLSNYSNRLKNILNAIRKTQDPIVIAINFLSPDEVEMLREEGLLKKISESGTNGSSSPPREKVEVNGNVTQDDYNNIIVKLESLQEESKDVSRSLQELKEDNKQLLDMMLKMTDTLSVLEMKFSYLEQQYNRPQ